jgi:hypothetical protein
LEQGAEHAGEFLAPCLAFSFEGEKRLGLVAVKKEAWRW